MVPVTTPAPDLSGVRVAFLSWRDTANPEGGGAERYLEQMAEGLVARGAEVVVLSADFPGARSGTRGGVDYRYGGSKLSVYPQAMRALRRGDLGDVDVVVDVQNGLPFFSRLVTRRPVIVLVHHVHREQWPVVYPGVRGRLGWWIERAVAPRLYRSSQYVAVSRATRQELIDLGVRRDHLAVVHNGTARPAPVRQVATAHPSICVVGRLVPHKQVEHAIDAALELRGDFPELRLTVVGSGWWEADLHRYAAERGAGDTVVFTGHVDEDTKRRVFEESWVMALPSLKEGWGLVVGEAGSAGTPTVAYRDAGGTRESVVDGVSGVLADDYAGLVEGLRHLLGDVETRDRMSKGAEKVSGRFTWEHAQAAFAHVVDAALRGALVSAQDEAADLLGGAVADDRIAGVDRAVGGVHLTGDHAVDGRRGNRTASDRAAEEDQ